MNKIYVENGMFTQPLQYYSTTSMTNTNSRPKKGSALLFFPSAGGIPNAPFDIRTLHCGEAVSENAENEKWIAQLWLCQNNYTPTAPENNLHGNAIAAMRNYCKTAEK